MVVCFRYLVERDLSSLRDCTRLHWTSHFLQGTKKPRPCLSVHPLPVHVEDGDLFLVTGSVLEGDDLGLPLLARDLHDGGQVMGRASCNPEQNIQRASY